ncbi:MAG: hypothetical protein JKY26_01530 [Pseudomonas sp.]|nr:hypothetical protein [Pseudomonas sp.]
MTNIHEQEPVKATPNPLICINGCKSNGTKLVGFFNKDKQLTATVSSNINGIKSDGTYCPDLAELSEITITAPNTKQGWYMLQQYMRINFSPFEYL